MIDLFISGTPRPQPRARKVKGVYVSTANKLAKQWRTIVTSACRRALRDGAVPISGPLAVSAHFYFRATKPERLYQPHTSVPDTDNLVKLILDVMKTTGLLGGDDSKVAREILEKTWAPTPGVSIAIWPYGDAPPGWVTWSHGGSEDDDDIGAVPVDPEPAEAL